MFGATYTRSTFWLVTFTILSIQCIILLTFYNFKLSKELFLTISFLKIILGIIFINTLANRIRDFGSNPLWALLSLLPLVGLFQALYFGIKHKKSTNLFHGEANEPELKRYRYDVQTTGKNSDQSDENRIGITFKPLQ
jgi:uncharacterized membrane protein YhaH (DUF805 family)